ncbi:shikimate kinase [bacterium]|nr:MAG: shikimate kinase [bacterium]
MSLKKHIYLTGFMGSGKSMIGRRLSEYYHLPFLDVDSVIEERFNMPVKELFEKKGEPFFRLMETATIEYISIKNDPHIVALGGGAACSDRNQKVLHATGQLLYLDVSTDLLIERLIKNTKRPLLLDENGELKPLEEIKKIITEMMNKRKKWYEKADICVKINQKMEKDEVTQLVIDSLKEFKT